MSVAEQEKYETLTRVILKYFDGLYHCDIALLTEVFHLAALYATATEGKLLVLGMQDYFSIVKARVSPASRNERRNDHIDSIEFAGPVTARAKLRCSIGPKYFTDFLTFILIDGQWRIISKTFHFDILEKAEPEN